MILRLVNIDRASHIGSSSDEGSKLDFEVKFPTRLKHCLAIDRDLTSGSPEWGPGDYDRGSTAMICYGQTVEAWTDTLNSCASDNIRTLLSNISSAALFATYKT